MSTVEEIQAELEVSKNLVASVSADVDALALKISELKSIIESGGAATQEQIDALFASAQSLKEQLSGVDAKVVDGEPVA